MKKELGLTVTDEEMQNILKRRYKPDAHADTFR